MDQPLASGEQNGTPEYVEWTADMVEASFLDFLESYGKGAYDEDPEASYYLLELQRLKAEERTTITIELETLSEYNVSLTTTIAENLGRLDASLRRALNSFIRKYEPGLVEGEYGREYYVSLLSNNVSKMRELRTDKLTKLTAFRGTVTRTSDVRPELQYGAFKCLDCNTIVHGVEQQFKFSPPPCCTNNTCNNRNNWTLVREQSIFCDWQRLKVQESVEEVPPGSLPRTIDVIMRHEAVESAKAGDKMTFHGQLVVVPDVGVISAPGERALMRSEGGRKEAGEGVRGMKGVGGRELTYRLMFIATAAVPTSSNSGMVNIRADVDENPADILAEFSDGGEAILSMTRDPNIYIKLTRSLAPSVFGHESIKQAVLLQLFGGVHKTTPEGINLRGDINVAIVGDPSCAKSQILKYVSNFLPRAVYTSGKASSAAGLTASVVKDPENNEFAIEAGALMLADNGICCIDEFDKMDIKDQVAIHEAMEQQTISIAKAGVQATLNARAAILAAANPVGGRYDKSKPLKYNVALPPAILSRFDLLHVMVDDTTEAQDERIAAHIINVHRYQSSHLEDRSQIPFSTLDMQHYIRYARSIKPQLGSEAQAEIVRAYRELRSDDAAPGSQSCYRITVRQLEALVRLSEAMARVYCDPLIKPDHVREAKKLLKASILKVEQRDVELDDALPMPETRPEAAVLNPMDVDPQANAENVPPGAQNADGNKRVADDGAEDRQAKRPRQEDAPSTDGAAGPAPKQAVKITAQRFNLIKSMLSRKMQEVFEAATRKLQVVEPGSEEASAGATSGSESELQEAGIRQKDLVQWYLETQTSRGALSSEEEVLSEYEVANKVINHLVRKQEMLAVASRPTRSGGEDEQAFLQRLQEERVLTFHANFVPEV